MPRSTGRTFRGFYMILTTFMSLEKVSLTIVSVMSIRIFVNRSANFTILTQEDQLLGGEPQAGSKNKTWLGCPGRTCPVSYSIGIFRKELSLCCCQPVQSCISSYHSLIPRLPSGLRSPLMMRGPVSMFCQKFRGWGILYLCRLGWLPIFFKRD